jgi:hypothetical protein
LALVAAIAGGTYALAAGQPDPQPLPALIDTAVRGTTDGASWELAVRACVWLPPGLTDSYTLSLVTAHGSVGTTCATVSRPASTYDDVNAGIALVFGSVPYGTTAVDIAFSGGGLQSARVLGPSADPHVGYIVGSAEYYVGAAQPGQVVTAITAYGSGSRLLEACNEQTCAAPSSSDTARRKGLDAVRGAP